MTRDFVTKYWHAIEALRDDELEINLGNGWVKGYDVNLSLSIDKYRRKLKSVLRPWTASEAIGRAVTRVGNQTIHTITTADDRNVVVAGQGMYTHQQLLDFWSQVDGSRCGVEVEQ